MDTTKKDSQDPTNFEDWDDYFEYCTDNICKAVHDWVVFSKLILKEEAGEVAKQMLFEIVKAEFDVQYPRVIPVITYSNGFYAIRTIILDSTEEDGLKIP